MALCDRLEAALRAQHAAHDAAAQAVGRELAAT